MTASSFIKDYCSHGILGITRVILTHWESLQEFKSANLGVKMITIQY